MKLTRSFGIAVFFAAALAISGFAQEEAEAEKFQKQIYGKWLIDLEETKKVLQKTDKKWTDEIVADAMKIISDMKLEIKADKSLTLHARGRKSMGTWSKPEYNAKNKTLKMTFARDDRVTDVIMKIFKVDEKKRLQIDFEGQPTMVFYCAKQEKEDGAGEKDENKNQPIIDDRVILRVIS